MTAVTLLRHATVIVELRGARVPPVFERAGARNAVVPEDGERVPVG
jgi:hypothetical protein